ncbi:MAG: aminotransferase class III-fold pyridoxal phosphate-dependent enzyme [Spirochaetaceae bacterium]|nr:MAG: aminotransferase class III-fold pyridoxal phosphate-dependent enzyme [Spirochaetaceae bacterium]
MPNHYPGPKSQALLDELASYVVVEPHPFVVDLAASRGLQLATLDGRRVTDWTGLYGSKLIGYNHPRMFEPGYLERLSVASATKLPNPDFLTRECLDYYRLLRSIAPKCMPKDRLEVYAVNSGAEAVENMMKYFMNLHQRKLQLQGKSHGVSRFLYFDQAFHGRTVFALNVTLVDHDPMITRNFHGVAPGNLKVPFPSWNTSRPDEENRALLKSTLTTVEYLLDTYRDEIAGVILEPIQGAGGHRIAAPEFYTELSRLCHDYDVFWGLDEVQTAGGQCGQVFAIDAFDIPYPPTAVAAAKKLANGVVFMHEPMEDVGVLDSTWGGTLSDMVRFVQEWSIVQEEKLIEQVPGKAAHLVAGLRRLETRWPDLVENVRGLGLYQGFTLKEPDRRSRLMDDALEHEDLLLLGAGPGQVRLRPPLDVTESDIDHLVGALERLLERQA